jgi:hypothetical protein
MLRNWAQCHLPDRDFGGGTLKRVHKRVLFLWYPLLQEKDEVRLPPIYPST